MDASGMTGRFALGRPPERDIRNWPDVELTVSQVLED